MAIGTEGFIEECCPVLVHERPGPDWFRLTLRAPTIARRVQAGQFVGVALHDPDLADPLLRRPLSVCTADRAEGTISLIYRSVGRGTAILARFRPGEVLRLLGPLGQPFPVPASSRASALQAGGHLFLVGGGLGIPPLALAAASVAGMPAVTAILGARTASYLAGADEVASTGVRTVLITEDGSAGLAGIVTAPLGSLLEAGDEVWACGPDAMLAAVRECATQAGAACWLSVERPMACGFGVCIGCTIPRSGGGFAKACVDGPVFAGAEVILGG